ncbi:acyltransferase [Fibrobacter sp.]|uniref:acyltransferase n=1 Tax=Fibrobacter sp. TaxID=35828 RepID=UPI0025B8170A|nr:acyltransferase [Fibrobacter sp.]
MNRFARAAVCVPCGFLKMALNKLFHPVNFKGPIISLVSPFSEITISGGKLYIGQNFKMRDGAKIRVRKGAECVIGNNTSVNSNNMIACHEKIIIGNDVQLSPNVQIYDHDHDFRDRNGLSALRYKTSPVIIGNNVWIGANAVILRGTKIGDNCVVGAGCVLKGEYPANSVIVQKRATDMKVFQNV